VIGGPLHVGPAGECLTQIGGVDKFLRASTKDLVLPETTRESLRNSRVEVIHQVEMRVRSS
jgi:hypothetical protein